MGSHSATCHPTQVNTPHLNPSHADRTVLDLPIPEEWKTELTYSAFLYADSHPSK